MGGHSSGRYRTRTRGYVEQFCRVDIRYLRRVGALVPGRVTSGTLRWSDRGTETGSCGYVADLSAGSRGTLRLLFSHKGQDATTTVELEGAPMRYGGFRFYAHCPRTGRRCEVLPIAGGVVACRQFHRLSYGSQSLDALGRRRERAWKLEARLWPTAPHKPRLRGRNRARVVEAWSKAEQAFERLFGQETARRFGGDFR